MDDGLYDFHIDDEINDGLYDFHIEDEINDYNKIYKYHYCVISIDIGVIHLAISVSTLDEDFNLIEIAWIDLIDITQFKCNEKECDLYHTKTFTDRLEHFFKDHLQFFGYADFVIIERQPPVGFVAIQELIFSKYRDKAILISPNSVHKFFNIGSLDYDQRKKFTEKIAMEKIKDPSLREQLTYYDRYHDIGDSITQMLYFIYKKKQEKMKVQERERLHTMQMKFGELNISINDFFDNHSLISKKIE